jgi:ribokinase
MSLPAQAGSPRYKRNIACGAAILAANIVAGAGWKPALQTKHQLVVQPSWLPLSLPAQAGSPHYKRNIACGAATLAANTFPAQAGSLHYKLRPSRLASEPVPPTTGVFSRTTQRLHTRSNRVPDKIVVIGSLNMDLVGCAARIPVVGETITGHTYFSEPGGKGANQAYAAAKLGGRVSMLGRVGSDDFGRAMRANLERAGCNVEGLLISEGTSGIALIFVADSGQNSIIIVPGANDKFSAEDVDSAGGHLEGAAWVLLQLENPLPTVLAGARAARRIGARVILDPAPARIVPDELFAFADIITPNETEAAILAGLAPGPLNPEQALGIARKLQARQAGTVIVKLGEQGCLLVVNENPPQLIPTPAVKAVDTTAAGDEFNAGLAVGLSEGLDLPAACRFANAAAALSVTRLGAQASAPTRAELDAFLRA